MTTSSDCVPDAFGHWFLEWLANLQETIVKLPKADRELLTEKFVEFQEVLSSLPKREQGPVDIAQVISYLDEIPRDERKMLLTVLQHKEEHTHNLYPAGGREFRGEFADVQDDTFTLNVCYEFRLDEIVEVGYAPQDRTLTISTAAGDTVVRTSNWFDSDVRDVLRALSKAKPSLRMTFAAAVAVDKPFDETIDCLSPETKQEFLTVERASGRVALEELLQSRYGLQELEARVWVMNWYNDLMRDRFFRDSN